MNRALVAVLLAVSGLAGATDEPAVDDFAYAAQLETPGNAGLYRVRVPIEIYRKIVRTDFSDLRVFNGGDEVVPHAVRRSRLDLTVRQPGQRLRLFALRGDPQVALNAIRVTIQSQEGSVDVEARDPATVVGSGDVHAYIADVRAVATSLAAITVEWPAQSGDFAALLDVDASDDLGSWRSVRHAAPIVNLTAGGERLIQQRVEFPATQARFWRLAWSGTKRPSASLSAVVVEPPERRQSVEVESLTVQAVRETEQIQVFVFDLGASLPVDRVNLELPDRNTVIRADLSYRERANDVWRPAGRFGFYRFVAEAGDIRNAPLPVKLATARFWRVAIDPAGGGIGSGLPQLTVGWVPHEIIFAARGVGPFTVAFGSATAISSEVAVDALTTAATQRPGDVKVRIDDASLGPVRVAGGASRLSPPREPLPWKSAALWIVLVVSVICLGLMAYRLAKEMGKSPVGRTGDDP